MIALVKGKTVADILIVGMINSHLLFETIYAHIESIAEVRLYLGEFEMGALAEGVRYVLKNIELVLEY